jgi:hypothetical protein
MTVWRTALVLLACTLLPGCASRSSSVGLSPNAPTDRVVRAESPDEFEQMLRTAEPCVQQAMRTFPAAKTRFLGGLPKGYAFYVVTRLHDSHERVEQAFVAVEAIVSGTIRGRIANEITLVAGYHFNQQVEVRESAVVDWLISRPDGSEEGNYYGKSLDTGIPCQPLTN